jgi:hypothetical protein
VHGCAGPDEQRGRLELEWGDDSDYNYDSEQRRHAASQAALAFGGNQLQQQTLIQGRALANVGVQLQNAVQTNIANNIAVQTNVAIPIVIKTR